MPTVPTYAGRQVREAALQPVFQNTPDVSSGLNAIAGGLDQTAQVIDRAQTRQATAEASGVQAQIRQDWLTADAALRQNYRGANADGYTEAAGKWWSEAPQKYAANLSPLARNIVGTAMGTYKAHAQESGIGYVSAQREQTLDLNYAANADITIQGALVDLAPANARALGEATTNALREQVAQQGAAKGWSTEQAQAELLRKTTGLHADVVANLMQADPTAADEYLKSNKDAVDAKIYARLEGQLKGATDAQVATTAADTIIAEAGGFEDGKPVELDKLTQAARDKFQRDPSKAAATIAEIQHRAQAFNASENERNAAHVSKVSSMIANGASLGAVRTTPEFQSLPGDRQLAIQQAFISRQQASAGLDLTNLQRNQTRLAMSGYANYLTLSDPKVLATKSEDEIRMLLPELGNAHTESLLRQRRALEKPDTKLSAEIDSDAFKTFANQAGLNPYGTKLSENEKARLGKLKVTVETAVDEEQQRLKRTLSRDERNALMQREVARSVKIDGGWFGADKTIPLGAITEKDAASIEVPADYRKMAKDALRAIYEKTKDPADAPTDANVAHIYLQLKAR